MHDPQAVQLGFRLLAERLVRTDAELAAHPWMKYAIEKFGSTAAAERFPSTEVSAGSAMAPRDESGPEPPPPAGARERWHSEFVHWCVEQAGWRGTYSPKAESWLNWGVESKPEWGCLVILEGPAGHVIGFHLERRYGREYVLGGYAPFGAAEGGFTVGLAGFGPRYRVICYRKPRPTP